MDICSKTPTKLCHLLLLCLLSQLALSAQTCEKKFYFGPDTNLDFAYSVAKDFIDKVHEETGCLIVLTPNKSFEELYQKALTHQPLLIAIDEYGAAALQNYGYKGLFTTTPIIQTYMVANTKNIPIKNGLYDLSNVNILGPSKYDNAHTFAVNYLANIGLPNFHIIQETDNSSNNIVSFLKQGSGAVITESFIYNRLPEVIRNKYEIIAKSEARSTTIMVNKDTDRDLLESMKRNLNMMKRLPYQHHKSYKTSPHTQVIDGLMKRLEKDLPPKA